MEISSNLFCKVFVDADIPKEKLVKLVALAVSGSIERIGNVTGIISVPRSELEIRENEDFHVIRRNEPSDGFLYFRYYIEVDALPDQQFESQVALVSHLLRSLWAHGLPAVAACDYEDKLPLKGRHVESFDEDSAIDEEE